MKATRAVRPSGPARRARVWPSLCCRRRRSARRAHSPPRYPGGLEPGRGVIIRIAMSALILTVPALLQLRGRWVLLRRAAPRVAVYGLLAVAGCQLFYFNALQRIPVGVALLLEYLGAVLVVLWAWLRHRRGRGG